MDEIVELALCEVEFLVLKTDGTLYRFYEGENCMRCQALSGNQ